MWMWLISIYNQLFKKFFKKVCEISYIVIKISQANVMKFVKKILPKKKVC